MIRHVPLCATLATICLPLVFGVHCAGGGSIGSGFTQVELYCQEAAAELEQCCPGYDPKRTYCNLGPTPESDDSSSCLGTTTNTSLMYPTLTLAESTCVIDETCSKLVSTGVCTRAMAQSKPSTLMTTTNADGVGCGGGGPESTTTYQDMEVDASFEPPPPKPVCP
jgi:hypothetical protein